MLSEKEHIYFLNNERYGDKKSYIKRHMINATFNAREPISISISMLF